MPPESRSTTGKIFNVTLLPELTKLGGGEGGGGGFQISFDRVRKFRIRNGKRLKRERERVRDENE